LNASRFAALAASLAVLGFGCGPQELEDDALSTGEQAVLASDFVMASIGDSFSSGEGVPGTPHGDVNRVVWGPWTDARRCHRSVNSFHTQASEDLKPLITARGQRFHYESFGCSGARASVTARDEEGGLLVSYKGVMPSGGVVLPPQIEQLNAWVRRQRLKRIDVLVVTIGVNDYNFGDVVKDCAVLPGFDCFTDSGFRDRLSASKSDFGGTLPYLRRALTGGATGSRNGVPLPRIEVPVGKIVFTTYPDPTRGDSGQYCSSSDMAFGERLGALSRAESQWLQENVLRSLNAGLVRHVASYEGKAVISDMNETGTFATHGVCASNRYFNNGGDAYRTQGNDNTFGIASYGTMHPNLKGHGKAAAILLKTLRSVVGL
jgi:hypothetical protein